MARLLPAGETQSSAGQPTPAMNRRRLPLGAAVANALFDATGKRLYRLPLTAERVKAALGGKEAAG